MPSLLQKTRSLLLAIAVFLLGSCNRQAPNDDAKSRPLVSGTIELSQEAQKSRDPLAVLFIMVRNPEGQMVAVKKLLPPFQFPMDFSVEESDVMIRGTNLGPGFKVTARLDKDGDANPAQQGDLLGQSELDLVKKGATKVRVVLDQVVK